MEKGGHQLRRLHLLLALAGWGWGWTAQALPSNRSALLLAQRINEREGPFLGLVVPTSFEMDAIRQQTIFAPHPYIPWLDLAGRRFHIGTIQGHKVVLVQSASAMLNAAITTQQLLDFFDINGVLHYGIAGSANDSLTIGDISIPKYWAHTALWNWEKFSNGSGHLLSSGPNGDFTQDLGHLHFSDFAYPNNGHRQNLLTSVWIQPEDVLKVSGTPEVRSRAFWGMELTSCFNATTCLSIRPKVVVGLRGASSNVFVDNAAYRQFMFQTFRVSSVDMESAAVALVCYSNEVPFIVIRSISDSAGNSEGANEVSAFKNLASLNAVKVLTQFLKALPKQDSPHDQGMILMAARAMATKLTSVLKPRKKGMSPQKKKKKIILSDADQAIGASEKRVARALVYPSASSTDVAEDEDDVEEMLRQFDLDAKFGPCVGLSRIERWERAQRHGLCPPQNIRDVLERVGGEPNCLWEGRV
ncbi:hypothetical protein SELMODRAFT_445786 [Selaginella moellendorffii]|uniref:Nucleoside phosphorylase domain-containing protein n=1 Tax=Selaginella moellendorffii TaxID=88036 RepID=D8SLE4_SELML|nr:hypothetical protein SELMODRAFT_445786 [Selaginella moellendorffii]